MDVPQAPSDDRDMSYTQQDAERVFNQPMDEVRAWIERRAAEQRPEVERAIASLIGTDSTEG